MPTYDYECRSCGHRYELFQPITAKPTKKCPTCGKNTATRLIGTGGGIIFRGSGFYSTDYRSDSYKKAAKADSESAGGSKKTETKADSKPSSSSSSSDGAGKGGKKE